MDDDAPDSTHEVLTVLAAEAGARLDKFLCDRLPGTSRSHASAAIENGEVSIAGVPPAKIKPAYKLSEGEVIEVTLSPRAGKLAPDPAVTFDVLFADESLAVLNKPAGLAAHPQRLSAMGTVANGLLARFGAELLNADEAGLMPGIVHRLDADTTGAMVVALQPAALDELKRQFREREVSKTYHAIVEGEPTKSEFECDAPIERDPYRGESMRVNKSGRPAKTAFRVLQQFEGYALLEVKPSTGRTHQIRVHLAHLGFPVVADRLYSKATELKLSTLMGGTPPARGDAVLIDRHALHALSLSFKHPVTSDAMSFEAPLPEDFERTLMALRIHRMGDRV